MNKEDRALFREVNKVLDEWEQYDAKPNVIRQIENQLEQFYDWADKNPKHNDRFNTRMKFNSDQLDELRDIATGILDDDLAFDPEGLYEKFQKAQGKHGIDTFEDYIEFLDQKEIFAKENVISSSMSYYEYEKLMQRAENKDVSKEDLNEMIEVAYLRDGLKGDVLYEFIYKNL